MNPASNLKRYYSGRYGMALLLTLGVGAIAVLLVWPIAPHSSLAVLPVGFGATNPIRWTPFWELVPAVIAAISPAFLAPRLHDFERVAGNRVRLFAFLAAVGTLVGPALMPVLATLTLPQDARWLDIVFNVLLIGSIGLLTTAWLGRLMGPIVTCATYVSLVAFQHLSPELAAHIPFSGTVGNLRPHPIPVLVLAAAASGYWAKTLGRSALASRLERNER